MNRCNYLKCDVLSCCCAVQLSCQGVAKFRVVFSILLFRCKWILGGCQGVGITKVFLICYNSCKSALSVPLHTALWLLGYYGWLPKCYYVVAKMF